MTDTTQVTKSESMIVQYKKEIDTQLVDQATITSLIETTFKKLTPQMVKRAMLEGMMRGFSMDDFLKKNVYAVPFGSEYTLITSIGHARQVGQKSGVVGKSAPKYEDGADGNPLTCTVTIEKKVGDHIGDFTATVYFDEYYTPGKTYNGKYTESMWDKKPRTMIAKVAEMHALRMACPEEMKEMYAEEEYQQSMIIDEEEILDTNEVENKIVSCETMAELMSIWGSLSPKEMQKLEPLKTEMKVSIERKQKEAERLASVESVEGTVEDSQ